MIPHAEIVAHLIRVIDALGIPAMVSHVVSGYQEHQTVALSRLLATDPEAGAIRHQMHWASGLLRQSVVDNSQASTVMELPLRTSTASYVVRCASYGDVAEESPPVIVASLDRRTPLLRSGEDLNAEFGLTRAESNVAMLIAQGCSNAEIAERLDVTAHTARRHTEKVLFKLNVRSRTEAVTKLIK